MGETIRADVAIVGAGITGLWAAKEFSEKGYRVVLIEKAGRLAPGPSSRNQGWLHRGTYHAAMIPSFHEAESVARNCAEGYSRILEYAPEAIEFDENKTYALIRNRETVNTAISRWRRLKIPYKHISKVSIDNNLPEIKNEDIASAFEVRDLSINTRMLYMTLFKTCRALGARILLNANFSFVSPSMGRVLNLAGESTMLVARKFIICAGYDAPKLYEELTQKPLKMRLWQSHLLILPRLTKHNVFYLDSNEATIMNHAKISIVSCQQDAVQVVKTSQQINVKRAQRVFEAAKRLVRNVENYKSNYLATSCIKPELVEDSNPSLKYSVDFRIIKPTLDHIFAFPGKMTEAPSLVKNVLTELS